MNQDVYLKKIRKECQGKRFEFSLYKAFERQDSQYKCFITLRLRTVARKISVNLDHP